MNCQHEDLRHVDVVGDQYGRACPDLMHHLNIHLRCDYCGVMWARVDSSNNWFRCKFKVEVRSPAPVLSTKEESQSRRSMSGCGCTNGFTCYLHIGLLDMSQHPAVRYGISILTYMGTVAGAQHYYGWAWRYDGDEIDRTDLHHPLSSDEVKHFNKLDRQMGQAPYWQPGYKCNRFLMEEDVVKAGVAKIRERLWLRWPRRNWRCR